VDAVRSNTFADRKSRRQLIPDEADKVEITMRQLKAHTLLPFEDISVRSEKSCHIGLDGLLDRSEIVVAHEARTPSPPRGIFVVKPLSSALTLIVK